MIVKITIFGVGRVEEEALVLRFRNLNVLLIAEMWKF